MKKIITLTAVIMLAFISVASLAQDTQEEATTKPATPRWLSDKGYWVVRGNLHKPSEQTLLFYNNDHKLVHEQTVNGKALNINKRKVKMQLKNILETSVTAWEKREDARKNSVATSN